MAECYSLKPNREELQQTICHRYQMRACVDGWQSEAENMKQRKKKIEQREGGDLMKGGVSHFDIRSLSHFNSFLHILLLTFFR